MPGATIHGKTFRSAKRPSPAIGGASARPGARVEVDSENVEKGLAQLVLTLIELLRQLMEKQAIRRMEAGSLTEAEIDRLGTTLMQLETRLEELKRHFEIDDLNIHLGPLGSLLDPSE